MRVSESFIKSLKKNIIWIIVAGFLYALPIFYRFYTSNSLVPIIDKTLFIYRTDLHITPVNLETIGLTFLIPSTLAALVGLNFLENIFERKFKGLEKYMGMMFGSLTFAFTWIAIHYVGYNFVTVVLPWGSSLWIGPSSYVKNLIVAAVIAPITPYIVELATFVFRRSSMKKDWNPLKSK